MKKPSKAPIDPHEIYLHAFRFHENDHRLRNSISPEDPNEVMLIAHPSMMLSAFASELYLKCLLCIETGKVHTGHDLKRGTSKNIRLRRDDRRLRSPWCRFPV